MVRIDRGRPVDLIGGGEHFRDAPRERRAHNTRNTTTVPMDRMYESVCNVNLRRPRPISRREYKNRQMR